MNLPRLVFWEVTRACNLLCPHCRASALPLSSEDLTTEEAFRFIDNIVSFSSPILVLSGGEPLVRKDIYDIADYGTKKGLKVVLASNATLITGEAAVKLKGSGIKRISVSIYGAEENSHDDFVGQKGVFAQTIKGIENIKEAGIPLQINTTITKKNLGQIKPLMDFSINLKAEAFHIFFLVPTGRGKEVQGDEISAEEYEQTFNEVYGMSRNAPIQAKVTCAPHYYRVMRQKAKDEEPAAEKGKHPFAAVTKGCLAGTAVCFVSHKGEVFPCGYFPLAAGSVRKEPFNEIWFNSELFLRLRDDSKLKGRCGICEFKKVCGGCRARAYAHTGDYFAEEPYCVYLPQRRYG